MHIQRNGQRHSYEVTGDGRPVVLLHAFPFDRRLWRDAGARLKGQAQVITPDLRGFGESDLGGGGFSLADLADDVAALLDALALPTAVVGGLSWGGYVALAFAHRHRGRLGGLILADTKAAADSAEARQARADAIATVRSAGVSAYLEKQIPRLVAAAAPEAVRAEVRTLGQQSAKAVIAGLEALRDRPDRRAELPDITCPTLVVVGSEDVLTSPAEARAMAAAIPGAKLVELPGAGHLANLEAPEAFSAALSEFLR